MSRHAAKGAKGTGLLITFNVAQLRLGIRRVVLGVQPQILGALGGVAVAPFGDFRSPTLSNQRRRNSAKWFPLTNRWLNESVNVETRN
jgi:hypothetical protein